MSKNAPHLRIITRRDSFKVVALLPATAMTTNWLLGCAGDHAGTGDAASSAQPGSPAAQAGSGTTATPATATPATSSSAGRAASAASSTPPAAASGGTAAPAAASGGQPAAMSSNTALAGSAPAASAGSSAATSAGGSHAGTAGASAGSMASASGTAGSGMSAATNVMWATGGTKSMQGNYPDPFAGGMMGSACKLYPTQTIGPCYADGPMMREDISDGLGGLPIRLSLLVVGKDGCTPIPNATVDIWHSGSQGIYSAYATGTTCNPGKDDVKSKMFCRGVQTTNESGKVNFSSVFPGWYMGRTIHIHFTVRLNGKEAVTSQLYFDDALTDEILAQGDYKARGKRDTNNTKDGIFKSGGATPDQVLLSTAKRQDGVLHAWKVLAIG